MEGNRFDMLIDKAGGADGQMDQAILDEAFINMVLRAADKGCDQEKLPPALLGGKNEDESCEMADKLCVEMVEAIYQGIIMDRKTLSYKGGTLDFSRSEGGNNHTELWTPDGYSYIWLDTHCGYSTMNARSDSTFAFCGKGRYSCNGLFREILQSLFPEKWESDDIYFIFSYRHFLMFYREVLARIR